MYQVIPDDIRKAAYGVPIPEGAAVDQQIAALIAKAELRLNAAVPTLAARLESGAVALGRIQGVVQDMVVRVVKNPLSYRSLGQDDFQATIDSSASTGLLYVSDAEVALLVPSASSRVGSIRLGMPVLGVPRV